MPYILGKDRHRYYSSLVDLQQGLDESGNNVGHLTFLFYSLIVGIWKRNRSYSTICAIRGVLIGTLAEFDRRIAGPYEDAKIKDNGDV
jgi:hypothetical protein